MLVESVRIIRELKLQSSILHDNKIHIRQVFARTAVVEMFSNVSKALNFLDEFEQRRCRWCKIPESSVDRPSGVW